MSAELSHPFSPYRLLLAAAVPAAVFAGGEFLWTQVLGRPGFGAMAVAFDFVFFMYAAILLLSLQRRLWLGGLLLSLVAGGLGLAFLLKVHYLGQPLRLSDAAFVGAAVAFYGPGVAVPAALAVIAVLAGFLWNLARPSLFLLVAGLPVLLGAGGLAAKAYLPEAYQDYGLPVLGPPHYRSMSGEIGNLATLVVEGLAHGSRQAEYRRLSRRLGPVVDRDFLARRLPAGGLRPVNVHLVVVESLVDPLRLPGTRFSRDPLAPLFRRAVDAGGLALSPVFGFRSPDTEWEVLCGIPASLDEGQVVFSEVRADSLDCLPRKLARQGWHTLATQPVAPSFFDSRRVYGRMGFDETRLAPELDLSDHDGRVGWETPVLSAGSLLRQNLDQVGRLTAGERPLFNYVFVTAGHMPFPLDESRRPRVIRTEPGGGLLEFWANHVHYNTVAVQDFVERVTARDPEALVVVIGDHAPPMEPARQHPPRPGEPADSGGYQSHEVPLLVWYRGRLQPLPPRLPAYLLPEVIADLLSDGAFCRAGPCLSGGETLLRPFPDRVAVFDRQGGFLRVCRAGDGTTAGCREALAFQRRNKLRLLQLMGYGGDAAGR